MAIRSETRIPPLGAEPGPAEARHVSPRQWQTEGAVCMGAPAPDRAPPEGWRGRGVPVGNMGFILPRP
jgi:hypothetical protein